MQAWISYKSQGVRMGARVFTAKAGSVDMSFESFVELYTKDIQPRLKENTWLTKESIIQKKILPYFAKRKLSEITAKDVIDWQNEIRKLKDRHGKIILKHISRLSITSLVQFLIMQSVIMTCG